jgi:hypothetical protein
MFLYALNPNHLRALAVAARCGRVNAREKFSPLKLHY